MFNKILVAADGSEHSDKAVRLAGDLAAKYDADLTIVHVLGRGEISEDFLRVVEVENLIESGTQKNMASIGLSTDVASATKEAQNYEIAYRVHEQVGERIIGGATDIAKRTGAKKITPVTLDGNPAQSILGAARDGDADLIVVGTRGLGSLKGLLMGSVSQKVSHLSQCTCITVK
jgi:nucleotide-binding universal stress UspA family protein